MVGRKRPRKVVAKRRGGLTLRKYSQPQEGDCRRTSTGSLCGALNSAVFMIRNGHEWAIRSGTTSTSSHSVIGHPVLTKEGSNKFKEILTLFSSFVSILLFLMARVRTLCDQVQVLISDANRSERQELVWLAENVDHDVKSPTVSLYSASC